jgi:hypothetical protein
MKSYLYFCGFWQKYPKWSEPVRRTCLQEDLPAGIGGFQQSLKDVGRFPTPERCDGPALPNQEKAFAHQCTSDGNAI